MEISPILLFKLLLCSFLWGIAIGALNDLNRISRALIYTVDISPRMEKYYEAKLPLINCSLKEKLKLNMKNRSNLIYNSQLFLQDILLTLIYIIGLVFLNYGLNKGDFRLFTVIASLVGAVLYYFTVGKLVFSVSEFICFAIRIVFVLGFYIVSSPFVYISTKIWLFFEKNYLFFQKSIAKHIKKRYNIYKEKNLYKNSSKAFLNL